MDDNLAKYPDAIQQGSMVTLNLSGKLDADASGSPDVFYLGDPTLSPIDTPGPSSVQAKGNHSSNKALKEVKIE